VTDRAGRFELEETGSIERSASRRGGRVAADFMRVSWQVASRNPLAIRENL
jgi:hypothetical protein